jgi:hypothetical protein
MRLRAALLFSLLPALGLAPPAAAQTVVNLGGVNLNYYCSKTFGAAFKSVLIGKTAGDWRCQQYKSKEQPKSISVVAACKLQYPARDGMTARALDWNNPLSWRCFAPKPKNPR